MGSRQAHYRTISRRDDLTPRQREVLGLIARGQTNGEIARTLGITLDGVKFHVSEILSRLGVDSREEAVTAWRDQNRVGARLRSLTAGILGAKTFAMVAAAVVVFAVLGVTLAIAAAYRDGGTAPAITDSTATTGAVVIATPEPTLAFPTPGPDATPPVNPVHIVNPATGEDRALPVAWGPMSWSPGGSLVAVANPSGTWLVDIASGGVRLLTTEARYQVAFSPDGNRLAIGGYSLPPDAQPEQLITVFNLRGEKLAETAAPVRELTWRLDGSRLAFTTLGPGLFVWDMPSDPVQLSDLTMRVRWLDDGRLVAIEAVDEKTPSRAVLFEPNVSSDRLNEADLASWWSDTLMAANGDIVSESGGSVHWVPFAGTTGEPSGWPRTTLGFQQPSSTWVAPHGTQTFGVQNLCAPGEQFVVLEPGEVPRAIAGPGVFAAAWSPDSTQVVYTTGTELSVVNADGTAAHLLASNVHAPTTPLWSPTGEWIAYQPYFGGYGRCD